MLDLRRLTVLCEVARHGSFSAAADALGYTQPAVSRQIATLEAEVGAVLVRRVPQGAVLTDAGRLLVAARRADPRQLVRRSRSSLQALAGLDAGHLRLASFASAAASIVPLAIAEFRGRHPAVEISIGMADPIDSLPMLRAGELDIALSHDAMGSLARGTATPPAPRARAGAAVRGSDVRGDAVGHPSSAVGRLALGASPRSRGCWRRPTSCPDSRLFLRACHAAGFEPRIAFQNDDYPAILGFVAAGVGVALVPDMVARGIRDDVVVRDARPAAAIPADHRRAPRRLPLSRRRRDARRVPEIGGSGSRAARCSAPPDR